MSLFDVAIIIPTYNAGACLGHAFDSIISQENLSIQIIIIEDGSVEPCLNFIKQNYAQLLDAKPQESRVSITYVHQQNTGAYKARLSGITFCNSRFIKFLDQDDILIKETLIKEVDAFRTDSSIDVVLSNWLVGAIKANITTIEPPYSNFDMYHAPVLKEAIDDFLQKGGVFTSAALYKLSSIKDVLQPVSNFTPVKADDWLIFAQVCISGAKYKTIENVSYLWNQSPEQLSRVSRPRLVMEHTQILNWIETELSNTQRLTTVRKKLLANYYAKQLLEAYRIDDESFRFIINKVDLLHPSYRQQHGNIIYKCFCNFLGLKIGVAFYSFLKQG